MRVIDDYAASGVNSALAAAESVDPDSVDRIAASAKAHIVAFTAPAPLHHACKPFDQATRRVDHAEARLVSRLWDISGAYRHLARAPKHASFARWLEKRISNGQVS